MKHIILTLIIALFSFPVLAEETTTKDSVYDRIIESGVIRCGYFTWPPFLTKDPNTDALSGISYDYMEAISKELDVKIEWTEETGFGEFITGLNTNRFDVMCMSIWPDVARLKNTTVTRPIFYSSIFAVVRADDTRFDQDISKINDPNIKVAILDGDVTSNVWKDDFPQSGSLALPQTVDASQLLQSVVSKKADVTFVDAGIVKDFIKFNGNKIKIVENSLPIKIFPEVIAIKKGELELKFLLDSVIDIITNNNVPTKILNQYEASTYAPTVSYKLSK